MVGTLFAFCGAFIMRGEVDQRWCLLVNPWQQPWPYPWALLSWSALGIVALLLITALSSSQPRRVAALLVAMVVGGSWVHLVKRLADSDRPLVFFGSDHPVFHVVGETLTHHGMPSGHSVTAMAMAGLMSLGLSPAWRPWQRGLWTFAWVSLGVAQALSRIVVGAHWPSDVLVGSAIGMAVAPMVWHLPLTLKLGRWFAKAFVRRALALLLPVLAVVLVVQPLGCSITPLVGGAVVALGLWGSWRWWRSALHAA